MASTLTRCLPLPLLRCCRRRKTSEELCSVSSLLLDVLGGKLFHDLLAIIDDLKIGQMPCRLAARFMRAS